MSITRQFCVEFFVVAFQIWIAASVSAAPIIWKVADGGNGHAYEAVRDSVTWFEANTAAEAADGHLATITSSEENDFVFGLVDRPELWTDFGGLTCCSWGPWLGGFQSRGASEPDEGWIWNTSEDFSYTNWWPGEPNNDGGGENHLHFFATPSGSRASTWNDFHGPRHLNGYVVEFAVPEPSTLAFAVLGMAGSGWRRRSHVGWELAPIFCVKIKRWVDLSVERLAGRKANRRQNHPFTN